jgi:hypothetical protein
VVIPFGVLINTRQIQVYAVVKSHFISQTLDQIDCGGLWKSPVKRAFKVIGYDAGRQAIV